MGIKSQVLCECDLCHEKKTVDVLPSNWVEITWGSHFEDRATVRAIICPICSWKIANKMGYATDKACPKTA